MLKAHSDRQSYSTILSAEARVKLHPMQIEILEQPPHWGRFGVLHGDGGNLQLDPDDRDTCSYCGSITIDAAIAAFTTTGVEWSGSDWKYGWPHKFYLTFPCPSYERIVGAEYNGGQRKDVRATVTTRNYKFYCTHLRDATQEQLDLWNRVAAPICKIEFQHSEEGLKFKAPHHGYQDSGTIGQKS